MNEWARMGSLTRSDALQRGTNARFLRGAAAYAQAAIAWAALQVRMCCFLPPPVASTVCVARSE